MNFVGSCGKPNLNFDPDSGAIASLSHIIGNEPSKSKIHILVGLNHISVFKMRCFRTRSSELHWPLHSYLYDLVEGGGALFPLQHPPSTFWWPPPTPQLWTSKILLCILMKFVYWKILHIINGVKRISCHIIHMYYSDPSLKQWPMCTKTPGLDPPMILGHQNPRYFLFGPLPQHKYAFF